jgi:single-strand DNA-binding protein
MNLNKVFILGRVTADPQLRTIPSGQSVTTFGVATNRVWTAKDGKRQEETEFHNVVVWGRQAEIATQFLRKGALVFIEGRLRTRSWQDKQGQSHKATEIICDRMQLGPRPAGAPAAGGARAAGPAKAPNAEESQPAEDIPIIDLDSEEIKPEDLPF